jgi:hypothetical protein
MHSKAEPTFEFQSGGKSDCPCCGGCEFAWGFCNPGGHGEGVSGATKGDRRS